LYAFSSPIRAIWIAHLVILDLIILITFNRRTSYEAPHYAIFSILLPLPPSKVHIFSSAPCSQTPSVYVLPLVWGTKFHTHTKQHITCQEWCGLSSATNII
jgi:hypothetical protein